MRRTATAVASAALVSVLALPALAPAQRYPAPAKPQGQTGKPKGPFKTLQVGKGKRYRTIQAAVNAARPGDTIRVADGVYREGVSIRGARKRHIKLIGNARDPRKVVIDAKGLRGAKAQNGVLVNSADEVTLRGLTARNQKGNGFHATHVSGFTFDRLIAAGTGIYGLYSFNARGGTMTNSLAYKTADGGFYVGSTPPQDRPRRTIIRNVTAWANVAGYTGTNSRYVTVTRSRFFNNGIGVVPNSLDSQKNPPHEHNVFQDNDVFWNNFDAYHPSAPFKAKRGSDFVYPPGIGMILLAGRETQTVGNRIWGNWLGGYVAVQNPFLKDPATQDLRRTEARDNAFGRAGDPNGRDVVYSGSGSGNCFAGNTGIAVSIPAELPACPHPGDNTPNSEAIELMLKAAVQGDYRGTWIQGPHAAHADGHVPLVEWENGKSYGPTQAPKG
jgi:hypothetical protein